MLALGVGATVAANMAYGLAFGLLMDSCVLGPASEIAPACSKVVRAGLIPEPTTDARGRRRYATTRKEGSHQLRHYYASIADGVSIKELAEYLGHHDPAFTLRVYAHLLPSSHEPARQAIDRRLLRPRAVSDGT